jgi:four helix bundle protein
MRDFKKLKIWIKGVDIAVKALKSTSTVPKQGLFDFCAQINSSASSIPSNIAEGSAKRSEKDYYRFVEIAQASSYELETRLTVAQRANLGDQNLLIELLTDLCLEQKMIATFLDTLNP